MYAFSQKVQLQDHTRRFSIVVTPEGWEVREERDSQLVKQVHYQDWHRVERARQTIAVELRGLREGGWKDVN